MSTRPASIAFRLLSSGTTLVLLLLASAPHDAQAQPTAQEASTPVSGERQPARRVGETTAALLTAQADGSIAGPGLPMLGVTSTLSWQRYLDSFKYKIPETFGNTIDEARSQ